VHEHRIIHVNGIIFYFLYPPLTVTGNHNIFLRSFYGLQTVNSRHTYISV